MWTAELAGYESYLWENEKSAGTIEKYLRDIRALMAWLEPPQNRMGRTNGRTDESQNAAGASGDPTEEPQNGAAGTEPKTDAAAKELCKETILLWRRHLQEQGLMPRTVNAMLSAVNGFLRYLGREDCRVRFLKVQRRLFRDSAKDLTRGEYERLVRAAAAQGRGRLCLLMETICATGIRVGELRFITLEAVRQGKAELHSKGKVRTILLPGKLCRKLKQYARERRVRTGPLFCTRGGRALSRRQIWAEMKSLCGAARVSAEKVFPHNLRHLFAVSFYTVCKDIVKLADIFGHSSIETTRIYLISTGDEHRRLLEQMRLVQ